MEADKVHAALRNRHAGEEWSYFDELRTRTGYQGHVGYIDAYAVGLWADNRSFLSYEIKVSRGDFKHDIEQFAKKQESALRNSTQFYFVCPQGLIKPEEVPEVSGLIYVNEGGCKIQKVAPVRELKDGVLDISFTRAMLRAAAGKPVSKNTLWKYMGTDMTEEQILKLAGEMGAKKDDRLFKREVDKKAAEKRQRSYSILKKFAESVGLGDYLEYGGIEEVADRMAKAYKDNLDINVYAVRIKQNAEQIAAATKMLGELLEKKNAEANR